MLKTLEEFNWISTAVRLALSLLCGGVLGFDRERKGRAAGFRTYMLVCMGATLVMLTNLYLNNLTGSGDVARLGAQVISGIGFLGAGTIIVTGRNHIKGLTTAAGLWTAACIGLALGIGFYFGAIIGCFFIYLIMAILQKIEGPLASTAKIINLYIEFEEISQMGEFFAYTNEHYMKISDVEMDKRDDLHSNGIGAFLTLRLSKRELRSEIISMISAIKGIKNVEEM